MKAALKRLSDNSNISVISVLASGDCLFLQFGFWLKAGYLGYYIMRLWILLKSSIGLDPSDSAPGGEKEHTFLLLPCRHTSPCSPFSPFWYPVGAPRYCWVGAGAEVSVTTERRLLIGGAGWESLTLFPTWPPLTLAFLCFCHMMGKSWLSLGLL